MKKLLFLFSLLVFTVSLSAQTFKYHPTASATLKGYLSSTDWTTFNNKFTLPSFTSGSVMFSNGTTLAQDNANLFWDDTNNRLGIGTTSPTSPFTNAVNSVVSIPASHMSGTWYSGGSVTTTKPHLLIEPTGTTSNGWSVSGTAFGINAASGFAGNLFDLQLNAGPRFSVSSAGAGTFASSITSGAGIVANGQINSHNSLTSTGACLYVAGSNQGLNNSSAAQFLGANSSFRTFFGGVAIGAPSVNTNYAAVVASTIGINIGASGTHPIFANFAVKPLTINSGAGTLTNAATFYLEGAATGTGSAINNYTLWVDSGTSRFDGRVSLSAGANIASSATLTLGSDGNLFHITGTTAITAITSSGWSAGSEVTLIFDSTASITAGANMLLSGGVNFSGTANDVIKLVFDGTSWFEVSRSVN